jgi:predicted MFS family arabinose efflux permease
VGSPLRLQRLRVTWLIYCQYAIFAFFADGFNAVIPLLGQDLHVSRVLTGLHASLYATGNLVAGLSSPAVVVRRGRSTALWGGSIGLCIAVALLSGPALFLTMPGALIAGVGAGLMTNTVAPILSDVHGRAASAAVSESGSLGSAAGAGSSLLIGLSVSIGAGWRPVLLLILPLVMATMVLFRKTAVPDGKPRIGEGTSSSKGWDGFRMLSGRYWCAWAVVLASVAIEYTIVIWASQLLRERTHLSAGIAATSVTAIVAAMATGRALGARLSLKLDLDLLLVLVLLLSMVGLAIVWFNTFPVISFAGLVICGLGIALQYPLAVSRAMKACMGRTDLAGGTIGIGTGLAIGGGPFALAALADHTSLDISFLIVPAMVLGALALVIAGRRFPELV